MIPNTAMYHLERRTPDGRVVGFAVLNFSKHDRSRLRLPWAVSAIPPHA